VLKARLSKGTATHSNANHRHDERYSQRVTEPEWHDVDASGVGGDTHNNEQLKNHRPATLEMRRP
jgi:hypothetical protein